MESDTDKELGELTRKILEKSNIMNIAHSYDYFLTDSYTKAEATVSYEKNGKSKKQNGVGPKDAMRKVVKDLENATAIGRMHAG